MSPSTANGHSQVQEPEFQQAAHEIEASLGPLFEKNPAYKRVFELCKIPERIIQFRVTWEDDKGVCQFNNGYRVQFNSALGPYKGGLRFHPSVNLSILKFLGFEQIFKNALTGLQMGGGKGGADFDPKGKSDNEIRKFCEAFMRELSRHIGDRTDVPAGDIGVGGREVAYMYGSYLRSRNEFAGILTGKGLTFGGSLIRNEATGYGLVYYVQHMIATREGIPLEETFKGRRVILSGSGNVSQFAALKVIELGGKVLALSDSTGSLISENDEGFTVADIEKIAQIKLARKSLTAAGLDTFKWVEGSRPWTLFEKVDIALPGATQNEVNEEEAKALVEAGCRYVAEGSNMGSTQEAINVFEDARKSGNMSDKSLWYAPGKASNAGGVAVSGLEMQQNASFGRWTSEEVDAKLKDIMATIFSQGYETGKEYTKGDGVPSLVDGSNISGFKRVVDAMYAQGSWW